MSESETNSFNAKEYLNKKSDRLAKLVEFFIIHIDDVSKSKVTKLEEWRRVKDPNDVGVDRLNRGKIISEIDMNADDANPSSNSSSVTNSAGTNGLYKLTLKDNFDNYCFAYEYNDQLPFLRAGNTNLPIPIKLGGKLIVKRGTLIANGSLLLNRDQCTYIGVDDSSELVKSLNSNLVEKSISILQNPDL